MSGILAQFGVIDELQNNTPAITAIAPTAGPPPIFTVTFGSAHGLLPGDTFILSGSTPSGYNGTWTVYKVPTATTLTIVTTSTLAANTVLGTYVASTYGRAPGAVSRFFDVVKAALKLTPARIESAGLKGRVASADAFAVNRIGGGGEISMEVQAKGFGFWLKYLLGSVATTGPADSAYTHTGSIAAMFGKSFFSQLGKPFTQSQVLSPFSYPGCKILDWTLACDVDGNLLLTITVDAQDEQTTVVLAAASYPTGSEILTYVAGICLIGGAEFDVSSFSVKCTIGYKADRRFMRNNTLKKEPAEAAKRDFSFTLVGEFTDLDMYNKVAATVRSGTLASLSIAWSGVTLIGAASVASLTLAASNARFDSDPPEIDGPDLLPITLGGKLLNSTRTALDAVTLAYVTSDSTP